MDAERKYPTWLEGRIKDWAEKRLTTMTLCSQTGGELLEVWYYGELMRVEGEAQPFIADTEEAPGMVFARDARSGEEFLIFDGAKHGYDAMAKRYPVCRGLAPWIDRVVEAHRAEKSESSLENVSTKGGVTEAMTTALRGGSTLAGSIAAGLERCAEISAELGKRFAAHAA